MIAKPPPDARLRFDPQSLGLVEPGRSFYRRTTVRVARDLLGAWIARRRRGRWYGARIVETEAYPGPRPATTRDWGRAKQARGVAAGSGAARRSATRSRRLPRATVCPEGGYAGSAPRRTSRSPTTTSKGRITTARRSAARSRSFPR